MITEFQEIKAVERNIKVELVGFREEYKIDNTLTYQFAYSDDEIDSKLSKQKHEELLADLIGRKKKAKI